MGELSIRIGKRLKEYRNRMGLTQAELAERTGLSAMTIRRYEKGQRDIDVNTWVKIASIFGISPKTAEGMFYSDQLEDLAELKQYLSVVNALKERGNELIVIFYDLTEEGQQRVIEYAKDMQNIYGGQLKKMEGNEDVQG